jgi:uncharacterized protein (TIGR03437 family)
VSTFKTATPRAVTVALFGLLTVVGLFAQTPNITAVVNAASFGSGIASNTFISIFGTNLASSTRTWAGSDFRAGYGGLIPPTSLDGVSVNISCIGPGLCSQPAYVEYVSPTQINALVPDDGYQSVESLLYGVNFMVTTAHGSSNLFGVNRAGLALAFFTVGSNYVAARHTDGSLVAKTNSIPGVLSRPARPGETISIYGTGFGPVTSSYY